MDKAGDPFAPLTEVERAGDVIDNLEGEQTGKLVTPIPGDAPPPPPAHFKLGKPTVIHRYRGQNGTDLFHIWRFDLRDGGKEFRPLTLRRRKNGLDWRWKAVPVPRPLYGLNRLADRPDAPVIVCEGEKCADAAESIFPDHAVITSSGGARSAGKTDWTPLAGRPVTIWPDNDVHGANYATDVAGILGDLSCDVSIIDAAALVAIDAGGRGAGWTADGWDAANAMAEWADRAALRGAALGFVKPWAQEAAAIDRRAILDDESEVARLAKLRPLDYDRERKSVATSLGVRTATLDRLVTGQRVPTDMRAGRAIEFPEVILWSSLVSGAALLSELVEALRRYVILTDVQVAAVALWVAFSHTLDAFDVSPRLVVKSPQKRSGKSTLFTALNRLVAKPRGASGITSSALLRLIELHEPTMLIDEMDALMGGDREMAQALRGLMNSGFNRHGATFVMNVPSRDGGYEPREFSTWCPLALAGIGDLPPTIRDRSIEIEMKRKLPTECVCKLRRRDGGDLNELAGKLARWAEDNLESLRQALPEMPEGLNDRASDSWEPLLAIADLAGEVWPERARIAAVTLSGEAVAASNDDDIDTMLLADIRDAFASLAVDRMLGETLTSHLTGLEGRPWAEWKHGKPISKHQLSKMLKKYGVVSGTVRTDEGRANGYHRNDLEDAFSRYCPSTPRDIVTSMEKQGENTSFDVVTELSRPEFENAGNPSNTRACHKVTSSNAPSEGEGAFPENDATTAYRKPSVVLL